MTTAQDLVHETVGHLLSGQSEQRNQLAANIDTDDTTLTFTYGLNGIVEGAQIAIDLEIMLVWSVNETARTASVQRAYGGSTAASHTSTTIVEIQPRFPPFVVLRALNAELDDLSSPEHGLAKVNTVDLTSSASAATYNLTSVTAIYDVLDVRYDASGSANEWPRVKRFSLLRSMPTGEFASGLALRVDEPIQPGRTLRVKYTGPFSTLATLATDVSTSGLPTTAYDIPPLGAAARLMLYRGSKRVFLEAQSDTRRPQEVSHDSAARVAAQLLALRDRRVDAERARLQQQFPPTRRY